MCQQPERFAAALAELGVTVGVVRNTGQDGSGAVHRAAGGISIIDNPAITVSAISRANFCSSYLPTGSRFRGMYAREEKAPFSFAHIEGAGAIFRFAVVGGIRSRFWKISNQNLNSAHRLD